MAHTIEQLIRSGLELWKSQHDAFYDRRQSLSSDAWCIWLDLSPC